MGPNKNEPPNVSYFQLQSWFVSPFISDFRSPKCSRIIPSSRQESKINYKTTEKWAKLQPPFPSIAPSLTTYKRQTRFNLKAWVKSQEKAVRSFWTPNNSTTRKGLNFFFFFGIDQKQRKQRKKYKKPRFSSQFLPADVFKIRSCRFFSLDVVYFDIEPV